MRSMVCGLGALHVLAVRNVNARIRQENDSRDLETPHFRPYSSMETWRFELKLVSSLPNVEHRYQLASHFRSCNENKRTLSDEQSGLKMRPSKLKNSHEVFRILPGVRSKPVWLPLHSQGLARICL